MAIKNVMNILLKDYPAIQHRDAMWNHRQETMMGDRMVMVRILGIPNSVQVVAEMKLINQIQLLMMSKESDITFEKIKMNRFPY